MMYVVASPQSAGGRAKDADVGSQLLRQFTRKIYNIRQLTALLATVSHRIVINHTLFTESDQNFEDASFSQEAQIRQCQSSGRS